MALSYSGRVRRAVLYTSVVVVELVVLLYVAAVIHSLLLFPWYIDHAP